MYAAAITVSVCGALGHGVRLGNLGNGFCDLHGIKLQRRQVGINRRLILPLVIMVAIISSTGLKVLLDSILPDDWIIAVYNSREKVKTLLINPSFPHSSRIPVNPTTIIWDTQSC